MEYFAVYIEERQVTAPLIRLLRKHTTHSLAELRFAIQTGKSVYSIEPHHNTYDEFIHKTTDLLDDLEHHGIQFHVIVDGEPESVQYVRNSFTQWREIGEHIERHNDLQYSNNLLTHTQNNTIDPFKRSVTKT